MQNLPQSTPPVKPLEHKPDHTSGEISLSGMNTQDDALSILRAVMEYDAFDGDVRTETGLYHAWKRRAHAFLGLEPFDEDAAGGSLAVMDIVVNQRQVALNDLLIASERALNFISSVPEYKALRQSIDEAKPFIDAEAAQTPAESQEWESRESRA